MLDLKRVSRLADAPILCDRGGDEQDDGRRPRKSAYMSESMHAALDGCLRELFETVPPEFGTVEMIRAGCVFAPRPGYHGMGRAFDLTGLTWTDRQWSAGCSVCDPRLRLGIESILRRHFGTVLTHAHDRSQQDHIHIDDGLPVGFRNTCGARVAYVQAALCAAYGKTLVRDGVWGRETVLALREVQDLFGFGGFSRVENWRVFLKVTAARLFDAVIARELVA